MKRLIAFAVLLCLLLCGCEAALPTPSAPQSEPPQAQTPSVDTPATDDPADDPIDEPVDEPIDDPAEDPTDEPTEEPTDESTEPAQPELVTVYLLQEAFLFDNGPVTFQYDEQYNVASYTSASMEGEMVFTGQFAQPDDNGMPGSYTIVWYDGSTGDAYNLIWDQDGKLLEDQFGEAFTGFQYDYDENGNLLECREYYEGMLDSTVYYEYDGDILSACWSEDILCNKLFECRVADGRIVEQNFYDYSIPYGYTYEYDEHGNLVQSTFVFDGEGLPGTQYTYIQVQVSAERAQYLQEQQKFLLTIV